MLVYQSARQQPKHLPRHEFRQTLTEIEMMENRLMRDIGLECCSALIAGKSSFWKYNSRCEKFPMSLLSSPLFSWLIHRYITSPTQPAVGRGRLFVHFARHTIFAAVNILPKLPLSLTTMTETREREERLTDGRYDFPLWEGGCLRGAGYVFSREEVREEERHIFPS